MSLLNLQCLEDLLFFTCKEGLPLPHLDRKSATSMANQFLYAVNLQNNPRIRSCELIIMDAGPLIKLASIDQLEMLLAFDLLIYIPDEVYFEAAEKFAWACEAEPRPAAVLLQKWVIKHEVVGSVSRPITLIGDSAKTKRDNAEYSPRKKNHRHHTGELAAHDFFNHRDNEGYEERPALILIDDGPAIEQTHFNSINVHVLSTYALLIALEQEKRISSAKITWSEIEKKYLLF